MRPSTFVRPLCVLLSATFQIPTLDTDIEVRSQTNGCAVRATNRPTGWRSCPSL
jgi:hypothetical protein